MARAPASSGDSNGRRAFPAGRNGGALPAVPPVKPFAEQGVSGTAVWGGFVQLREQSPKWVGYQRYRTISDMAVNTPIIATGVRYVTNLIAHPAWSVSPAVKDDPESEAAAELVEEVLHDCSRPWSRIVRRAAMYAWYGFSVQEWTAKRRSDGKIGLASIEPRPQHTIERWDVDEAGNLNAVYQRSPQTGALLPIPRTKIMYLVDDALSDSPEGVGVFRHLAAPWERLRGYHKLETMTFERDLRGIPVGKIPYTLLNQAVKEGRITAAEAAALVKAMEDFVQVAVKESNTAITVDSAMYESQAQDGFKIAAAPQWDISLLQGSANGLAELDKAITRTQWEMARIMGVQHLMMGSLGSSGNRSLSEDSSRNLYLTANAVLTDIASAVDHDVIPAICTLNNIPEEHWPTCSPEEVAFKDAATVAETLQRMALAGATISPDDPVVDDVRDMLGVSRSNPVSPELAGMVTGPDEQAAAAAADQTTVPPAPAVTKKRRVARVRSRRSMSEE